MGGRLTVVVAAAGLVAVGAVPARADAPVRNGTYKGKTTDGRAITAKVTGDADVLQLSFDELLGCGADAKKKPVHTSYASSAVKIDMYGRVKYFTTLRNQPAGKGLDAAHVERRRVTAEFENGAGNVIRGRVAESLVATSGEHCKATTTFTVKRTD